MSISRETWEEEYGKGRWEYLRSVPEMARYAVIAAYVRRFSPGPKLLDVGSGECVLSDYLDWSQITSYTGIDLSSNALARARLKSESATLITADIEQHQFPPDERFDVIVFNEVLNYAGQPLRVLENCARHLSDQGVLVVSLWRSQDVGTGVNKVEAIWRGINQGPWRALDETVVTNVPTKSTWRVRVMSAAR